MMREVRDQLRPDATSLGLEIVDVRIRRTDLTREVSQQTYERMKAERLAEAERLRARGREAAQRIRARADREVVEIIADARRESEILRGEGEAERNALFADAFSRDPEFFEFYRSMAAYTRALEGEATTMLLSPDSEFFRFFGHSMGRPMTVPTLPEGQQPPAEVDASLTARRAGHQPHGDRRNRVGSADPVSDLIVALGLVLVIEGILYGGLPRFAKRLAAEMLTIPDSTLRIADIGAAVLGLVIVWAGTRLIDPSGPDANAPHLFEECVRAERAAAGQRDRETTRMTSNARRPAEPGGPWHVGGHGARRSRCTGRHPPARPGAAAGRTGRVRSPILPKGFSTRWSTSPPRRPAAGALAQRRRRRNFPRARPSRISSKSSSAIAGRASRRPAGRCNRSARASSSMPSRASSSPTTTSSPMPTRSRSISPMAARLRPN
jgi:uncharacterized protein YjeT (DUF2065 family)